MLKNSPWRGWEALGGLWKAPEEGYQKVKTSQFGVGMVNAGDEQPLKHILENKLQQMSWSKPGLDLEPLGLRNYYEFLRIPMSS